MNYESAAALVIYVFVALGIVVPLALVPMGTALSYAELLPTGVSIIHRYIPYIVVLAVLLIIGGFLATLYGPIIMRPIVREILGYYSMHGVFDVFIISGTRVIFIALFVASVMTYLVNTEVIRIPGYNYIPYLMMSARANAVEELTNILGLINLALNTWLVVSASYLQLRIAGRLMMRRLGGAIGVFGTLVSTGTATVAGAVCTLGSCAISGAGATPLAIVLAYLLGREILGLGLVSPLIASLFMVLTLALLVVIHNALIKG